MRKYFMDASAIPLSVLFSEELGNRTLQVFFHFEESTAEIMFQAHLPHSKT